MKSWASIIFALAAAASCSPLPAHAQMSYGVPVPVAGLPGSLGQKTMAGSTSVTVASDQSAIPVTIGAGVTANQGTPNTAANGWPVKPTDGTNSQSFTGSGEAKVSVTTTVLPPGASTSANQGTEIASLANIDTSTAGINGKLGSLGQKAMAGSAPVVLASDQSAVPTKAPVNSTGSGSAAGATVSTVITLSAPANAVGFMLMNLDTSTANLRWAVGRTATTTLGQQLQPGRDTGFVPVGANVSLVAESGTQNYDIQWVSQ